MIVDPASSGTFLCEALVWLWSASWWPPLCLHVPVGAKIPTRDEQTLDPEAKIQSLEESFEALADENVELRGEIAILGESLDDLDERLRELEEVTSKVESVFPDKGQWTKDERVLLPEGTALGRTVRLVEDSGGEVHYVDSLRTRRPRQFW